MENENTISLKELKVNESAIVQTVGGEGHLRQHLLDMGIIPGAKVKMIRPAPMGDPIEIRIHDYELTLRRADAGRITVRQVKDTENAERFIDAFHDVNGIERIEHPGLGEEGKYHVEGESEALPDGTILTFALAGNQNSGKTTLFNQLTGSNQRIGNFPGVTVDRKDGSIKGHHDTLITDLPGIYSMSPYSGEERVSRNFILNEKPKAIINIVDATNIERNLYLTVQLLEMQIPTVVALNMMDELSGNGGTIDINKMEAMLGVPVIPISALKNEGVD
ncbi:MAG: 50S ribosome-binding GTPase, partial [Synergistaceae bacterium]|nr:50S ribosome-binding GTPase [Synergistaceae bacterium]